MIPTIESVLDQSYADIELVVCDNASTDDTQVICRDFAASDPRVAYHRNSTNIGLLNNFSRAAELARGNYVRWIGDSDRLHRDYVSSSLDQFADDERRVLVTTQITYVENDGITLDGTYDAAAFASPDPVVRFTELMRICTAEFALIDPLYGLVRREWAILPRRNILGEDNVFAARLALAGPWGHVAEPLAWRSRSETSRSDLTSLLGVPVWQSHVRDLWQSRELLARLDEFPLDHAQRQKARVEVARLYARRKVNAAARGVSKVARLSRRSSRALLSRA
jgi:glycosyltransferase involved in cell wall biosynthesis